MGRMDGVRWIILLFGSLVAIFFGGCSAYFGYVFIFVEDLGEFQGIGMLAVAAGSIVGSFGLWILTSTTEKSDNQSNVWRHHLLVSRYFSALFGMLVVIPATMVAVKTLWPHWNNTLWPHWNNLEFVVLVVVTVSVLWLVFWQVTKSLWKKSR